MELKHCDAEDFICAFIREINFKLSDEQRKIINAKLEKLNELVPADSHIQLILTMVKNKDLEYFRGELKVDSLNTNFLVVAHDFNVKVLVEKLDKKILEQLRTWKRKRFQGNPHTYPTIQLSQAMGGKEYGCI